MTLKSTRVYCATMIRALGSDGAVSSLGGGVCICPEQSIELVKVLRILVAHFRCSNDAGAAGVDSPLCGALMPILSALQTYYRVWANGPQLDALNRGYLRLTHFLCLDARSRTNPTILLAGLSATTLCRHRSKNMAKPIGPRVSMLACA